MRLISDKKEESKPVIMSFKYFASKAGQEEVKKLLDSGVKVLLITKTDKEIFEVTRARF